MRSDVFQFNNSQQKCSQYYGCVCFIQIGEWELVYSDISGRKWEEICIRGGIFLKNDFSNIWARKTKFKFYETELNFKFEVQKIRLRLNLLLHVVAHGKY